MAFKTIMTHVEPDGGSARALQVAAQLAAQFEAHLTGVGAESFDTTAYGWSAYGMDDGGLVQTLRDQIDLDLATAQKRFAPVAQAAPAGSNWICACGNPTEVMVRHACGADLIVARRRSPRDSHASVCDPAELITAAAIPVLLCPDGGAELVGARVLVAWRDSHEARRSLADALPFLQRAQQVALVQVRPAAQADAGADDGGEALKAVTDRLLRLGVEATAQVVEPGHDGVGVDLTHAAERFGADLIVCGAYSHMRLREWALGGVTQSLLDTRSRYVLFSH